jgi:hypothetical protein
VSLFSHKSDFTAIKNRRASRRARGAIDPLTGQMTKAFHATQGSAGGFPNRRADWTPRDLKL